MSEESSKVLRLHEECAYQMLQVIAKAIDTLEQSPNGVFLARTISDIDYLLNTVSSTRTFYVYNNKEMYDLVGKCQETLSRVVSPDKLEDSAGARNLKRYVSQSQTSLEQIQSRAKPRPNPPILSL